MRNKKRRNNHQDMCDYRLAFYPENSEDQFIACFETKKDALFFLSILAKNLEGRFSFNF
jgi:hypothetical protein